MGKIQTTTWKTLRAAFGAVAAVLLAVLALGTPAAQAADCAGADEVPAADNLDVTASATLCLLNEQRALYGLPALRRAPVLDRASAAYAGEMVDEQFFAHVGPDGSTVAQRLRIAGYGDLPNHDWVVGENIAWGQEALATPRNTVERWMGSPGHRRNILSDEYSEVGIGIALGAPVDPTWGATYTTDFGIVQQPVAQPVARACARPRATLTSRRLAPTASAPKPCRSAALPWRLAPTPVHAVR
jgi:uncharacterized protein YkwD